ncbi:hypothetical protein [Haloarcula marina]|uniref:hypothetical protein n=1 Tax=Haloarcula marina TaxID=2961574 RepID=UPI0020B73121|nr:hypothetical protein [Halomicroarcula marina]
MAGNWTRRELLARLGAAGGLGALAGCPSDGGTESPTETETASPTDPQRSPDSTDGGETPTASASTTTPQPPTASDYDRVVDVVEAGADPNGRETVLPVLNDIDPNDTLVEFPPGEYFIDGQWRLHEFQNFAVRGPEATITTVPNFTGPLFGFGGTGDASNLAVEGFTFDFRQRDTGPRPLYGRVRDGLYVGDVTVRGEFDIDQDGMRFDVTAPGGTGVVRNLRMPDGGHPRYPNTGCYVGETHRGHLRFEECRIDGFPDNGLYASPAVGRVDVLGGEYRNSGVSNVRVSGPATVRGVTVRCNEARAGVPNMRGIRLREGSDILVDNCRVVMDRVTESDGAITCAEWLESATVRNTHVTVRADGVRALWAKAPQSPLSGNRQYPLQVRNLTVDGSAATDAAVMVAERPGTLLETLCICQSGAARDGVHLLDSGQSTLSGANITVTGTPLVTTRSPLSRQNIRLRSVSPDGILHLSQCGCG